MILKGILKRLQMTCINYFKEYSSAIFNSRFDMSIFGDLKGFFFEDIPKWVFEYSLRRP